jgi:hypothetical protein
VAQEDETSTPFRNWTSILAGKENFGYMGCPAVLVGGAVFTGATFAAFLLIHKSANDTMKIIDHIRQGINSDFASINNATSLVEKLA